MLKLAFSRPVRRRRELTFSGPVRRWREFAFSGSVRRRRELVLKVPFSTTELGWTPAFLTFGGI
jgi:hypothetical protein